MGVRNKGHENLKKGVKFEKGKSGNPKGRPKKIMTKLLEIDTRYTKQDVRDTMAAIAGLTEKEVKDLANDPDATMLEKAAARAFEKAKAKGDYKAIKDIVEMFADKAKQHTEMKIEVNDKYSSMDDAELERRIKELMAQRGE